MQEHLAGSAGRKPEGSTATRVKTIKFRDDQIKTVQAAIDRAKKIAGAEHDEEALEAVCKAYVEGGVTATPAWLVGTVADYLSGLDADERAKFRAAVNARVTPSPRHMPAKGLFIGVEVVQPAGFGARSSSRPDAGPYDDFLQIDAPVNQGNSAGPTFNAQGEVVGVNTAIFSPSGGSVGIGFAVASDAAKGVVQQLKDTGKLARGWLGMEAVPMTQDIADSLSLKDAKGAIVATVEKDSPAAAAGLKVGDVVASVNGESVVDADDLALKIAALGPKKDAELKIIRNGSPQTLKVTLGALPDDKQAQADANSQGSSSKDAMAKYGMTLAPAAEVDGAGKTGVVVANVDPDGAAAQKGIRTGDIILEVAGKPVSRPSDVTAAIDAATADGKKSVPMHIRSEDNTRFVALSTQVVS